MICYHHYIDMHQLATQLGNKVCKGQIQAVDSPDMICKSPEGTCVNPPAVHIRSRPNVGVLYCTQKLVAVHGQ
jgi:hypothetical protein